MTFVLALLAAGTVSAADAVSSTTTASNLRYTLKDLVPNDDHGAGVTFTGTFGSPAEATHLYARAADHLDLDQYQQQSGFALTSLAASWDGHAQANAGVTGAGSLAGAVATAAAQVQPMANETLSSSGSVDTAPFTFTLAPHTAITFYLDASFDLQAPTSGPAGSYASGEVDLLGTTDAIYYYQDERTSLWAGIDEYGNSRKPGQYQDTLSLTLDNEYGGYLNGMLYFRAVGGATSGTISMVPEPGSWAMFAAAGLLYTAMRTRRRTDGAMGGSQ